MSVGRPAYLDDPGAGAILKACAAAGIDARFVGGCVRDAAIRRPIADIDLAAAAPPDRIVAALDAAGLRHRPTGLGHGVVTVPIDRRGYEITALRRDVATDGRRATVAFTEDWGEDAARRDFTMNAMSMDGDGRLFDPFGGLDDARAGRLRFVGDAETRVREDALRILRFFRLFAQVGAPPADPDALAACRAQAASIEALSAERIAAELRRWLATPQPGPALDLAAEAGVLDRVFDFVANRGLAARLVAAEGVTIGGSWLRRLGALHPRAADAAATAGRLKLSRSETRRLIAMLDPARPTPSPKLDAGARARAIHRLGPEVAADRALLAWAAAAAGRPGEQGAIEAETWRGLVAEAAAWSPPPRPFDGADAAALGAAPGPVLGAALAATEDWWIGGGARADRVACLEKLKAEIERSPPGGEDHEANDALGGPWVTDS